VLDFTRVGVPDPPYFEDPEEDFYSPGLQLVRSMPVEADSHNLSACQRELPRLKGKKWWLTKVVETFAPEEMVDLEFEAAIPFLAKALRKQDGEAAAHCLPQYGSLAASAILDGLRDSDTAVQTRALVAAGELSDSRFVEPLLNLLQAESGKARLRACYATANNWDRKFVKPLVQLLRDPEPGVASAAQYRLRDCLRQSPTDLDLDATTLRAIVAEDGPATLFAVEVLDTRRELTDEDRMHLLSSTNLPVLSYAFTPLRDKLQLSDLAPLMTNSLPMARLMALGVLVRMADKSAVDGIVSMLHDPNEDIRWRVRSGFRRLTSQKLGADPAAYEKWWAENKDAYVAAAPRNGSRSRYP
jgi:hypothetical protein